MVTSPERILELGKVIESWNMMEGDLFDSAVVDMEIKRRRICFIEGKKKDVKDLKVDIMSTEFELIRMMMRNPEMGWKCVCVLTALMDDGVEVVVEVIKTLVYEEGRGVFLPEHQDSRNSTFDSRLEKTVGSSDVSSGSVASKRPRVVDFHPSVVSTPKSAVGLQRVLSAGYLHFPKMCDARKLGWDYRQVRVEDLSQEEMSALHSEANEHLVTILKVQDEGCRKPIRVWKKLIGQGLFVKPGPLTYHRNYKREFLVDSFQGEPLPGVFLPCGSSMSEEEAIALFVSSMERTPATIVELNKFVEKKFPVTEPVWDPTLHVSHIKPFSLSFYAALALPIQKPGLEDRSGDEREERVRRRVTYSPYNWHLARQRINMHGSLLESLAPYMADPLLTSLALSPVVGEMFLGLALESPSAAGRFICRTRPFFHNNMTYSARVNPNTEIGRCNYCCGLYILPTVYVVLCYFVPSGLVHVSEEILHAWRCGQISVCAVHFLHKSMRPDNGMFASITTSF